jgi:ribosome-binding ATPase YchF (GTP1/OBG family)
MDKIQSYIQKTADNKLENCQFVLGGMRVCFKDKLAKNISIESVLKKISKIIPKRFLLKIDMVYVGDFDFLKKRNINASFEDGTIYLSNKQDTDEDILDDLIHEIAHAVEKSYDDILYYDGRLEAEFLHKRTKLYQELSAYDEKPPDKSLFYDVNYNEKLDDYFFQQIGYEKLQHFISGIFPNCYSVTSLSEYFATGFEIYFLDGPYGLTQYKELYSKIDEVLDAES